MTRIIAGAAGGRRIATPAGSGTRPTSDRVREAIFGRLEHLDALAGSRVLDLYAGSGALGLEAASRDAASVLLVESDRKAAAVIARNVRELRLATATVRIAPVEKVVAAPLRPPVDLVFADPPYAVDDESLARVLAALVEHESLAEDAVLVVERSSRSPEPTWPVDVELIGPRRYGETTCWFAQFVPEGESA
ncbi:16S rRNA (guanine(966)-N(2))-methyltransferase RsmD [Flexivirga sp. ID2601S]|uniref:16S rRNA (Guanine(966)-N(2))-methyltransferase RsmD n=1 Tax=Flexivirga aerilata TaxID=1656889 RepID=A0A849AIV6_9MICO|nr:16S rRNA (guanine(966)-N(2))-methyltransferase RsmD [Flexivirga aerilata]NNG40319.1 16S rRNA (guanine(966)-N(2))-methyltransferase RsmD [Flexivirga aerilata]